jgi:hypothetical protein
MVKSDITLRILNSPARGMEDDIRSQDSSVSIAVGYEIVQSGYNSRQRQDFFFHTTVSRLVLGPTKPPIQWVLVALSQEVKWQGCKAYHSPSSSAEIRKDGAVPPLPHMSSWHGA